MPSSSRPRPSFKETFVAVGQDELDKTRRQRALVFSAAVPVTGLMVLAAILYPWFPIGSVVALVCALILLWGRWVIHRQTMRDMVEMRASREAYGKTNDPQYAEFVRLRGEQMLRDNKALTAPAKEEIGELLAWAGGIEASTGGRD